MALKILRPVTRKTPSIKHMVHRALAGYEKSRNDGYVHASDLMKELEFCPREWALRKSHGIVPKDEFIGTSLRITFCHGKDMEYRFRNEWLRSKVVGNWKCGVCGTDHGKFGYAPDDTPCHSCGHTMWEYEEVRFKSPYSGVSGGCDTLVDVAEPLYRVLEIKSIDKDYFKDLQAPLAEHKARTALYLRLAEESHLKETAQINTDEAHLIYVAKAFGFKDESIKEAGIADEPFSPFKEFVIKRDDSLTDTVIERARVVKAVNENPTLGMPCGICKNGLEKRAQKCSVLKQCWNGTHPHVITWKEKGVVRHNGKKLVPEGM